MSKRREEQAFADGKMAFRDGTAIDRCPRREKEQRAAWRRGWEEERGRHLTAVIPPEQLAEAAAVVSRLKAWAKENLR